VLVQTQSYSLWVRDIKWVLLQDGTKNWFHYIPYAYLGWSYNSLFQKVIPLQIVLKLHLLIAVNLMLSLVPLHCITDLVRDRV
jgi:hypothetical protein